jgi:hypothetical protein
MTEPRRFKLPSEKNSRVDDMSENVEVERDEYVAWRRKTLKNERDDLALRGRLLGEEATTLRDAATRQRTRHLESLTPEDWSKRHLAGESAPEASQEVQDTIARAAAMEAERDEIATRNAHGAEMTPADHYEQMRADR